MRALLLALAGALLLGRPTVRVCGQDFPLLSGHTVRTYYRGEDCGGAAFYESIEQFGACVVSRDGEGRAVGSYAVYLCSADNCYGGDGGVATTSEPTTDPTEHPSTAPPRRVSCHTDRHAAARAVGLLGLHAARLGANANTPVL